MKLGLGTVQFGTDYGIANSGQVDRNELVNILSSCQESGLVTLDTSPGYGDAERKLGQTGMMDKFDIITKMNNLDEALTDQAAEKMALSNLKSSLNQLGVGQVNGVICHNPNATRSNAGAITLRALLSLKQACLCQKIGVSIYDNEDVGLIVKHGGIDLVQLPLNVFDQRFVHDGSLSRLKEHDIEIHVRSVFLQGLLLMEEHDIAIQKPDALDATRSFHKYCHEIGVSNIELALGFVAQLDEVDKILVGVATQQQLRQVIEASKLQAQLGDVSRLPLSESNIIDPRNWGS